MLEKENRNRIISKRIGRNVFETPPRISVVIPAYNNAEHISETLDSVLAQKYREHEIIVVNDGSPDSQQFERAIKMRIEDIIYIKQQNSGAGPARNTGIEHARGQIIAFLDAGDVWQPDFLASQYVFLERHGYDLAYCDAVLIGMHTAYRKTFMETAPSDGEANFDSILDLKCNVLMSGTMARKRAITEAGMFERERVWSNDFHLWLRMAANGAKIGYQRKQLLKHRLQTCSIRADPVSRAEHERDAFERVRRTINLTEAQIRIVENRIAGLESDLALDQGKSFLRNGDYAEAAVAFRVANRHRRSLKLTAVTWLTRLAPTILVKFYLSNGTARTGFVPR